MNVDCFNSYFCLAPQKAESEHASLTLDQPRKAQAPEEFRSSLKWSYTNAQANYYEVNNNDSKRVLPMTDDVVPGTRCVRAPVCVCACVYCTGEGKGEGE